MRAKSLLLTAALSGALATVAAATPSITPLGGGVPLSLTNSIGGTYYIGGSGTTSVGASRWTFDTVAGTLSVVETGAGTSGGGMISKDDGLFVTTGMLNNPRFATGNAATGITPPYTSVPASLAPSSSPAITSFGGGRWSIASNTYSTIGAVPSLPLPSMTITTIVCTGGEALVTTAVNHGLAIGDKAIIAGNSVAAYNGIKTVTAVDSATTFKYAATCGANGTGGVVLKSNTGSDGIYGPSGNGATGSFLSVHNISANGRFVVGQAYVCAYNTAGTSISAESFYWRPVIWDAQGNAGAGSLSVLPTPYKTSASSATRRRTGMPAAVSNDGLVIVGAQEHNTSVSPGLDVDGARLVVWRWNAGSGAYDMSFLDTGIDVGTGFPKIGGSTTASAIAMNTTGTIIAARGPDGITKWVWDSMTSSWGAPIVIGSNLTTPATWLPSAVTTAPVNIPTPLPVLGGSLAMTDDGNTIVGSAVYSTGGSFMSGGFIWRSADGLIQDWYDYAKSLGTPGVDSGQFYGPIGDLGDPSKGLPVLGYPTAISPDGSAVTCLQGGTQRIPGAPTTIVVFAGTPCIAPTISVNPAATTAFNACTSSIILNVSASGTAPYTYQWYKDGNPLADGTTVNGSVVTGATSFQCRVNAPLTPADAGTYYCVVNGQCGSSVQTTNAVVSVDVAFPAAANDLCAGAATVLAGTNVIAPAQSPCASYAWDANAGYGCGAQPKNDLWFVFNPLTSGNFRFDTCGANFDTTLSIFDNCTGGELACNNDYLTGTATGCSSQRSRIGSYALTAGIPVYIRVAANNGAFISTTSTVNLSITPAPASVGNDLCDNAFTAVLGANALDSTEAYGESTASCAASAGATRDVWFKYTPPALGLLTAATCPGTTWNTVLSLYTDCFGSEVACNDNAGVSGCSNQSSIAGFQVDPNTTYYFRVGGSSNTNFGAGTLTLSFAAQGACCTGGVCTFTTSALCATGGGTYKGNGMVCDDNACLTPCQLADFNHVDGVTADDIFAFLDAWFAQNGVCTGNCSADIDGLGAGSNAVSADDIFAFLDLWFVFNGQTCP